MRFSHHPVTGALSIVTFADEGPEVLREAEERYERMCAAEERMRSEAPRSWRAMIREAMDTYEMDQAALAQEIGVTPNTVSDWLVGRRKPAPARVGQLAAVLNMPKGELMGLLGYRFRFGGAA